MKPGTRVLVKPNLLADVAPERAVTTHPEFVRQVIRALMRAGAQVQVGDSPARAIRMRRSPLLRMLGIFRDLGA